MKKILLIIVISCFQQMGNCQEVVAPMKKYRHYTTSQSLRDDFKNVVNIRVNEHTGDTIKIYFGQRRFEVKSKGNVFLAEGQLLGGMGTDCGCESAAHGLWIERYRNGHLKEQGQYYCNEKIGQWIYGYENGNIERIESYERPYPVILSKHRLDFIFQFDGLQLKNRAMQSGSFKAYYENGQPKMDGQYVIMEEFSAIDTVYSFDLETYERIIYEINEGEFWNPKAFKIGVWNYYDERGKVIKWERISYRNKENEIRPINTRYKRVLEKIKKGN